MVMAKYSVSEAPGQEQSYLIAGEHWLQNHGQCLLINMNRSCSDSVITAEQVCDAVKVLHPSLAESENLLRSQEGGLIF